MSGAESRAAMGTPERTSVSIDEAREIILGSLLPLGCETVGLREAVGRVLAEELSADRLVPPLDNSAMDGYALRREDVREPPAELRIVEELPAGKRSTRRIGPGEAARILTGAAIPEGADAVVRQEDTERLDGRVRVLEAAAPRENIRPAGCDCRPGTQIAGAGTRLRPAHVGAISSVGRTQVSVVVRPRVAVLATGDELVEPDRLREDGRIVSSNSYGLQAALLDAGAEPVLLPIARDEPERIEESFRRALHCDAVVSTGGVSVGDRDWIKQVLGDLGGVMRLWRVRMKPGAPLAFVVLDGRPVFGLPGNPVSTLVTFEQFVRPALLHMMHLRAIYRPVEPGILTRDYEKPAGRAHLARVQLEREDGRYRATPYADQSSAILLSMVQADGLAFIPEDATRVPAGAEVPVQLIHRDDLCEEPGY